jgi:hypothetical protein
MCRASVSVQKRERRWGTDRFVKGPTSVVPNRATTEGHAPIRRHFHEGVCQLRRAGAAAGESTLYGTAKAVPFPSVHVVRLSGTAAKAGF